MFDFGIDHVGLEEDFGCQRKLLQRCGCVLHVDTISGEVVMLGVFRQGGCPMRFHDSTPGRDGAARYLEHEIASIKRDLFG